MPRCHPAPRRRCARPVCALSTRSCTRSLACRWPRTCTSTTPIRRASGLVDWRALNRAARAALDPAGAAGSTPGARFGAWRGDQMLVRIAATLIGDAPAWLYVMDEPTAALTNAEAERLLPSSGTGAAGRGGALRLAPDARGAAARPAGHGPARRAACVDPHDGRDGSGPDHRGDDRPRSGELFPAAPGCSHGVIVVLRGGGLARRAAAGCLLRPARGRGAGGGGPRLLRARRALAALIGDLPVTGGTGHAGGSPPLRRTPRARLGGRHGLPAARAADRGMMLRRATSRPSRCRSVDAGAPATVSGPRPSAASRDGTGRARQGSRRPPVTAGREELSGGNQQKVLFARALAGNPRRAAARRAHPRRRHRPRFELYRGLIRS